MGLQLPSSQVSPGEVSRGGFRQPRIIIHFASNFETIHDVSASQLEVLVT